MTLDEAVDAILLANEQGLLTDEDRARIARIVYGTTLCEVDGKVPALPGTTRCRVHAGAASGTEAPGLLASPSTKPTAAS